MKYIIIESLIVIVGIVFIAGLFNTVIHEIYGEFEYTSMNGEKGNANMCTISYGNAYCRDNDGTKIIVESYRKIK